jgi:uncharacterized membrane protein YraQ (UPF0718 family)
MILICAIYVATFVVVYKWVIVHFWGYERFLSRTTLARAITGWVLAALAGLWMPIRLERWSEVV